MQSSGCVARSRELLQADLDGIHGRTDRLFANLMVFQWLAGIVAAYWISPLTWLGAQSQTHPHVWAAIFFGGGIAAFPIFLARTRPGWVVTRHAIAVGQMFTSALLIHLTGGRIETHFHVFGSLAFLAIYRDWRVLLTATVVTAIDHFARGMFWPQSVFGVLAASPWRWLEHAGWVVFEDVCLIVSIRQSLSDMVGTADRQARLETVNLEIEGKVVERTVELTREIAERESTQEKLRELQHQHESILNTVGEGIHCIDREGRIVFANPAAARLLGWAMSDLVGQPSHDVLNHTRADGTVYPQNESPISLGLEHGREQRVGNEIFWRKDGASFPVEYTSTPVRDEGGGIVGSVVVFADITERKRAEEELRKAHKELLETSRQAGMAEVATAVLHNVGNVLNSVNVASLCVADGIRRSRAGTVGRVAALLQEHSGDLAAFFTTDPRGQQLPAFLLQLAEHLAAEQASTLEELGQLQKNIDHIKEIVAMQQSFAQISGVKETLQVAELVEDTLRLNGASLANHGVRIERDYTEVPPVVVEKHKALQILINLVRNAENACEDSGRTDRWVALRIRKSDRFVKVSVSDNGIGIPPENLTRIFNHGFTTKKGGHGFGLHSGALAARELGGSLRVESEGTGCGATFTLELPCAPAAASL